MKYIVLFTFAFFPLITSAQTDSIAAKIRESEQTLAEEVWKYGTIYRIEKEKNIIYKSHTLFSGNKCLVMYHGKKAKDIYLFSPDTLFYFDLKMDGIIDGKYRDLVMNNNDVWKNVVTIANTKKSMIETTVISYFDLAMVDKEHKFQLYDLRDSIPVIYNVLRSDGNPEIISVPKTAPLFYMEIENIKKRLLALLEFEEFQKN